MQKATFFLQWECSCLHWFYHYLYQNILSGTKIIYLQVDPCFIYTDMLSSILFLYLLGFVWHKLTQWIMPPFTPVKPSHQLLWLKQNNQAVPLPMPSFLWWLDFLVPQSRQTWDCLLCIHGHSTLSEKKQTIKVVNNLNTKMCCAQSIHH